MTRKEAIKVLKSLVEVRKKYFDMQTMKNEIECLNMAIKALEEQPSEDCISREAVLKIQAKYAEYIGAIRFWEMRDDIRALPSATPQPGTEGAKDEKVRCWIEHNGALGIPHIECPECGCWFLRRDLPHNSYCPNCGSRNHWDWELKMEGEQK